MEVQMFRLNYYFQASARKQDRAQRQRDKLLEQRAHTAASLQPVKPAPKEPLSPDQREKKVIVVPTPVSAWRSHFDSKQCRLYGRRMLDLSREYEVRLQTSVFSNVNICIFLNSRPKISKMFN
eukprot:TRINITY_DN48215_c0_g1_i6.p1 TRINITY_DN48215_c0_g1~~TRINITY_DN48215_c0_g1_i6.p1  ORF type:complete len:123 (-),score=27.93 TRINITY_DN48215_c0_g1_i6:30-398(-)